MAIKDILEDIEKKRQDRIASIRRECAEVLDKIQKEHSKEKDNITGIFNERLAEDLAVSEKREIDSINMEKTYLLLHRKTEIISELLSVLNERLSTFKSGTEYESILSDSITVAEKTLGKDFIIKCSPKDKEFLTKKSKELIIQEDPSINGGILCYSAKGDRVMDLRLERLFREIKPEIEAMILENIGAN
ncbi:MAG: V-type ATP synthase subunit E family protein [Thermoplasmataceae archaeon]